MFGRSKLARLKTRQSTRRVIGAAVLTLLLAIFMTFSMAGDSKACPPGLVSTNASLSHKLKFKALAISAISKTVVSAAAFTSKVDKASGVRPCCGGASHFGDAGCQHGCCSSGAVALFDTGLIVAIGRTSSDYVLPQGDQVTLANPAPNLRPPRLG